MKTLCQFILVAALIAFGRSSAQADIQLFSDFPGASLESWSTTETNFGETIQLVGEHTWTARPDNYRWVHFRAEGLLDRRPEFQIGSADSAFLGELASHRFVWSYDATNWSFFDNSSGSSDNFRFNNDEPFTQNQVYVAYSTPYPLARTVDHVQRLQSKWFVTPTASGTTDLVVGESNELPLYGFRITNPLVESTEKTSVVLVGGNHSGEHAGNFALEGMIDFLTSDDARARQMRNVAEFFVYPQVDPLGRTEGFYRGNSQNPASDHNRFWDAPTSGDNGGFAEIDVLTQAMVDDTGGDVDFSFDFHGFFDSGPSFLYADTPSSRNEFVGELLSLEPDLFLDIDDATEPAGIFEFWAKSNAGLNATHSYTPELTANASAVELIEVGESYALAMFAQLGSPQFFRSTRELDTLTRALRDGDIPSGIQRDLDLNRDGVLDEDDLDFLIGDIFETIRGDTNLDGRVEFSDFLVLSRNFSGEGGWGDGDFDGDSQISFSDFLVLSRNFGGVTEFDSVQKSQSVPEPLGNCWFALAMSLGVLSVSRSQQS